MTDFHVISDAQGKIHVPQVRRIEIADVIDALKRGFDDFRVKPSHYVFLCLIYPLAGIVLVSWSAGGAGLQLIYPLMSGFALLGPLAAIGLYEISRRRELKLDTSWTHAFDVRKSPAIPAILAVGALLLALFVVWIFVAGALFRTVYGDVGAVTISEFARDVLTTGRGFTLIAIGNLVGAVFALVALATTAVAFPVLLDRDVGAAAAIETSFKAFTLNPGPMIFWGFIVAVMLVIGSVPLFVGLAVVMPILGHSTWHLYRKVVTPT